MKPIIITSILLVNCFMNQLQGQKLPVTGSLLSHDGIQSSFTSLFRDTTAVPGNTYWSEWLGGLKGSLISTGGLAVSSLLVYLSYSYSPTAGILGPGGFMIGLLGVAASIATLPLFVSGGVNRAGQKMNTGGKYWQAFVGSLAGTVVFLTLDLMVLNTSPGWAYVTIPLTFMALVPAASALTYQLFGNRNKTYSPVSLLNFTPGDFEFGKPVPVVYPDPYMQNKICTQISLLKISF